MRERLNGRELHALRCIGDCFLFRPICRIDASAQFRKRLFWNMHMKRTNSVLVDLLVVLFCEDWFGHHLLLRVVLDFRVDFKSESQQKSAGETIGRWYCRYLG